MKLAGGRGKACHFQSRFVRALGFKAATFRAVDWGGMAPNPARTGRIARCLFSTCYLPVTSLLWPNYLPVMVLFCARRRFLINPLKTNGFRPIIEARTAPEQGEKGG
jgi:hypothetical protein